MRYHFHFTEEKTKAHGGYKHAQDQTGTQWPLELPMQAVGPSNLYSTTTGFCHQNILPLLEAEIAEGSMVG